MLLWLDGGGDKLVAAISLWMMQTCRLLYSEPDFGELANFQPDEAAFVGEEAKITRYCCDIL
jgi:hypothetical protein